MFNFLTNFEKKNEWRKEKNMSRIVLIPDKVREKWKVTHVRNVLHY